MSETLHASCVAIQGRAVLLAGASGAGKSDLSLRLLDRGFALVSDDYTELTAMDGRLFARPPATIAGKIEMRGVGIVERPFVTDVPVALLLDLNAQPDRLPVPVARTLQGVAIPSLPLRALEPSAPLKVEAALMLYGLS